MSAVASSHELHGRKYAGRRGSRVVDAARTDVGIGVDIDSLPEQ